MKKLILLAASCVCVGAADLKESKFTQVVNDVKIISTADNAQKAAQVDATFKVPDVLRTGPASRAELVAEDRTITRVGANTIFSFDQANRSIKLEKGSLLFNSPRGKGGGSIHTAAATAAVIGTTIIVTATPDGGFKVLTLEGRANVNYSSGVRQRLDAGQMTFVLPGSRPGPVVMFRLDQQVGNSTLVKGFTKPLPGQPKIEAAVSKQEKEIESGRVEDTGLLVGDGATENGVKVIKLFDQVSASEGANEGKIPGLNDDGVEEDDPLPPGFNVPPRLVFKRDQLGFTAKDATNSATFVSGGASGTNPPVRVEFAAGPADASLDSQTITAPFAASDPLVFRERVDIFTDGSTYHNFTGFIGDTITINTPTLDLNQFAPLDRFTFFSMNALSINSDLTISASQIPEVSLRAGSDDKVSIASGKTVTVDSPSLTIISPGGVTWDGVTVRKQGNTGLLDFSSDAAVSLNNSVLSGGNVRVTSGGTLAATGTAPTAGNITGVSSVALNSSGGMTVGVNVSADPTVGSISMFNSSGILQFNPNVTLAANSVSLNSPGGVKLNTLTVNGNSMSVNGGSSETPLQVLNSTFTLGGSLNLQNTSGSNFEIANSTMTVGSLTANTPGSMTLNNDTITATGPVNLNAGSTLSLTGTPITANTVGLNSGGALTTFQTEGNAGKIQGNSSVNINSGAGATLGTDITAGTSPGAGSINIFNSSQQLVLNPNVALSAGNITLNSPDGITLDDNILSGGNLTLTAGRPFGGGSASVRNSTVTLSQSLNVNSRAGVLFENTGITAGSVSLSAGDSENLVSAGAGPITLNRTTFDLTGSMNVNNDTGVLNVDVVSRITAAGTVTMNSREGMRINGSTVSGNNVNLASANDTQSGSITVENASVTGTAGGINIDADTLALNNANVTAVGWIEIDGRSVGVNNSVLQGEAVVVDAGTFSAPNVAPNTGRIQGNSLVSLTSQSGGMNIGIDVKANPVSGTINIQNNGGVLNVQGGIAQKTFEAGFITVSSPGGLLFDGTKINAGTRATLTAGNQVGTLAVVQNTSFSGASDVNIAGHTVVLNNVNFADGSIVNLRSLNPQLAPNPNSGATVQGGMVNYILNVNYNNQPAQNFTGAGKPITISPL